MPSKRQPSKQRRAAENRAKRQALAARSVHAQEPKPTPSKSAGSSTTSSSTKATSSAPSAGGGGLLGMLGLGGGGGGFGMAPGQPGARAMTLALMFVPLSIIGFFVVPFVEVDDRGDPLPTTGFRALYLETREFLTGHSVDTETVSVWSANGAAALPFILLPTLVVVVTYLAFRNKPAGRTLTIAMLVLAATVILGGGAFFLPSLVAIGIASFQVRRSEMVAQQRAAAEDAAVAEPEDDDEYEDDEDDEYEDDEDAYDEDVEGDEEEGDEYEDGDVYDEFPDEDDDEDADEAEDVEDDAGKSPR